ncbi:MAG: phosphatidylethanolamine-binding protein (PEBP) family uncharacterized protein [Myxococcota bacterium]|jgi:phosphatidylethanolamine-binding protein (PEBP) family uncharacterized protein
MRLSLLALLLTACTADAPADTDMGTDTSADSEADTDSGTEADTEAIPFRLSSPDFISSAGDPNAAECDFILPPEFSCRGSNPELAWEGAPDDTTHFILVFDDPSTGNFPHWAMYDIPGNVTGLDAGISGDGVTNTPPGDAVELVNGFDWEGYLGSCPGRPSQYRWRLFAMDGPVGTAPTGSVRQQFTSLGETGEYEALATATLCHLFTPE